MPGLGEPLRCLPGPVWRGSGGEMEEETKSRLGGACAPPAWIWSESPDERASEKQPTANPPNHMKHHFTPLTPNTARLVIESVEPFQPWKRLTISRLSFGPSRFALPVLGAVLGRDPGRSSAMILDVRRRDLVVVLSKICKGGGQTAFRCFRVTNDWKLQSFKPDPDRVKNEGLEHLVEVTDQGPAPQVDSCSETLRDFLAEAHPWWLEEILERQVTHWRSFKPEQFFRLVPSRATPGEFVQCFLNHPLIALANFKSKLTKKQLKSCIRRSLKGGVMYAFDELTPAQIRKAEADHPDELIRFVGEKLSDSQLRRLAEVAPWAAFRHRLWVAPEMHAFLLSSSYRFIYRFNRFTSKAELNEEIIRSITDFPAVWLTQHGNDFGTLLLALWLHLELAIPLSRLAEMLVSMPAQQRGPLVSYLADAI